MTGTLGFHAPRGYSLPGATPAADAVFRRTLQEIENLDVATGGGATEWDCVVDNTGIEVLIADAGDNAPSYTSITDALNDFAASGRVRCWALVRATGNDYNETGTAPVLTGLERIYIFGQGKVGVGTDMYVRWYPNMSAVWGATREFLMHGIRMECDNPAATNVFSGNTVAFDNCELEFSGNSSWVPTNLVSGNYVWANQTTITYNPGSGVAPATVTWSGAYMTVYQGEFAFGDIGSTASRKFRFGATGTNQGTFVDLQYWRSTSAHITSGLEIAGFHVSARILETAFTRAVTGNHDNDIWINNSSAAHVVIEGMRNVTVNGSGVVELHVRCSGTVTHTAGVLNMAGDCGALTSTASGATATFTGTFSDVIDVQGKWAINAIRTGGNTGSAEALKLRAAADDGVYNIGGNPNASAGAKPYTIDAGSDRNIVHFAGASTYAAAGTDAGAGNNVVAT